MPRKKNPNNNYFNQNVEDAVCAYLHSTNEAERNKHFKIIYPALCKIAEVWYHKLKFTYSDDDREDVMASCVAWLVEKMDKFQCGMGTKAFSYYTVTAKFYYMQLSNKNYRYFQRFIPISDMGENWDMQNSDIEDEKRNNISNLYNDFIDYCNINFDKIFSTNLKIYGRIILDTISKYEDIQDYRSRKVLQIIYRNGNVTENQKTKVNKAMNVLAAHFNLFRVRWASGNESLELCQKNELSDEEKSIIKSTIVVGRKNNGTVALAKKFGVDVKVVTEFLKTT